MSQKPTPDDVKKCSKCAQLLSVSLFATSKQSKDGYQSRCRECANGARAAFRQSPEGKALAQKYRQSSIDGWLAYTLFRMRQYSEDRGHPPPEIQDRLDLLNWLGTQPFIRLWADYAESGFNAALKPSIDRLDNSRGYDLDNIRLVTWQENWAAWSLSEDCAKHCRENGRRRANRDS